MINFDTARYERPIRAPVVTPFDLGHTKLTRDDLRDKWTPAANKRHMKGEHAPIVIGHTRDGMVREEDQPTATGLLTGPFVYHESYPGLDGPCMSGNHWIQRETLVPLEGVPVKLSAVQVLDKWPRRSGELYFRDYKIDPHCLLGPTTPCNEMGPLRLNRDGEVCVEHEVPYRLSLETAVADEPKDVKPKDTEKDTGVHKQLEELTAKIMALSEAVAAMQGGAPGAAPGAQGGDPNEEAEIEKLLAQLGHGGAGGGQEPPEEPVKQSRVETEVTELKVKLRRMEIEKEVAAVAPEALAADPDLVADLGYLPPDVYKRQLDRLKLQRPQVAAATLAQVVAAGNDLAAPATGKKKVATVEDNEKITKLARETKGTYESAAASLGYEVSGR